ncbi:hypothetical protein [Silvibacterium acidisoli]|uniref:hypothetical protein n=1 Tax=Acidobacteriaceae bacterium ZG23-2 TaxID=2883246 RepID=UPI00406D2E14
MRIRLLAALLFAPSLLAQCVSHSWESLWKTAAPVHDAKQFAQLLPAGAEVRYAVTLSNRDEFVAYVPAGARPKEDPQDGGFLFVRGGKVVLRQSLLGVANWKKFARDIGPADKPAFSVFVNEFCANEQPRVALGFSACCSDASAVLYFLVTLDHGEYKLAQLPVVGGGRLQIFPRDPVQLRVWSGKEDGKCEECEQHFRVSDYRVVNGAPTLFDTKESLQMYKPGEFAPHRISLESARP